MVRTFEEEVQRWESGVDSWSMDREHAGARPTDAQIAAYAKEELRRRLLLAGVSELTAHELIATQPDAQIWVQLAWMPDRYGLARPDLLLPRAIKERWGPPNPHTGGTATSGTA